MPPVTWSTTQDIHPSSPFPDLDFHSPFPSPIPDPFDHPENPEELLIPKNCPSKSIIDDHQKTLNLAEAISLMTEELKHHDDKSGKAKAKDPDTFDGSNPCKLNSFLLICILYFHNNPSYADDDTKVTFALTYLHGTALDFFEPALSGLDDTPEWLDNWSAFIHTLCSQFGPIDPTADAKDSIDNLKMQDNQCILKYNIDFNRLSIQTGWNDNILWHCYYSGLAKHIKDIMGQQGKPPTLTEMKLLAHAIDSRHWEWLCERSCSNNPQPKSENKPKPNSKTKSDPSKNQLDTPILPLPAITLTHQQCHHPLETPLLTN